MLTCYTELFVCCSKYLEALAVSRLQLYVSDFVTIFIQCLHKIINIQVYLPVRTGGTLSHVVFETRHCGGGVGHISAVICMYLFKPRVSG